MFKFFLLIGLISFSNVCDSLLYFPPSSSAPPLPWTGDLPSIIERHETPAEDVKTKIIYSQPKFLNKNSKIQLEKFGGDIFLHVTFHLPNDKVVWALFKLLSTLTETEKYFSNKIKFHFKIVENRGIDNFSMQNFSDACADADRRENNIHIHIGPHAFPQIGFALPNCLFLSTNGSFDFLVFLHEFGHGVFKMGHTRCLSLQSTQSENIYDVMAPTYSYWIGKEIVFPNKCFPVPANFRANQSLYHHRRTRHAIKFYNISRAVRLRISEWQDDSDKFFKTYHNEYNAVKVDNETISFNFGKTIYPRTSKSEPENLSSSDNGTVSIKYFPECTLSGCIKNQWASIIYPTDNKKLNQKIPNPPIINYNTINKYTCATEYCKTGAMCYRFQFPNGYLCQGEWPGVCVDGTCYSPVFDFDTSSFYTQWVNDDLETILGRIVNNSNLFFKFKMKYSLQLDQLIGSEQKPKTLFDYFFKEKKTSPDEGYITINYIWTILKLLNFKKISKLQGILYFSKNQNWWDQQICYSVMGRKTCTIFKGIYDKETNSLMPVPEFIFNINRRPYNFINYSRS